MCKGTFIFRNMQDNWQKNEDFLKKICGNGKKVVILRTFLNEILLSAAAHARGLPTDSLITLYIGG